MKQHTKTPIVVFILMGMALLASLYFTSNYSDSVLQAFSAKNFYLEGNLVFQTPSQNYDHLVVEYRCGADYGIEYSDTSYVMVDGQYYVDDKNDNSPAFTPTSREELYQFKEMFARASILSNFYNFSDYDFFRSFSVEIPELLTGKALLCTCREYTLSNPVTGYVDGSSENIIDLYFRGDRLYAIQAKEDPRYLFYVSSFSDQIPKNCFEKLSSISK